MKAGKKMATHRQSGLAAMELMAVVAVLIIGFAIAVPLLLQKGGQDRSNLTRSRLLAIKKAVTGDKEIMVNKVRADFGFVGDLGLPPANLNELMVQGAYPAFSQDNQVWFGWRGPYLDTAMENGNYVALLDGWGRALTYSPGADPVAFEIRSAGPDGIYGNDDDLVENIFVNEISQFVNGSFLERVNKTLLSDYHNQLRVFYPAGVAGLLQADLEISGGRFDSQPLPLRLPPGHRFFQTEDDRHARLATLNGGDEAAGAAVTIDFMAEEEIAEGEIYEMTFDASDDGTMQYTVLSGNWSQSGGDLIASGVGEHQLVFQQGGGNDYRVSVNATLSFPGSGYGIYYRSNGQPAISGYCFQYRPILFGILGVSFQVRRFFNGVEQAAFQQVDRSAAQFPGIYNQSHQVSITVQADRHIIKVDGQEIMNFTDNTFLSGLAGLRFWGFLSQANFHHVLIHPVPPLASGEIAWWSFEEGDGTVAYGSGFVPGVAENNGQMNAVTRVARGIFGKAISSASGRNVTVAEAPALNPGNRFSMEAWARPSTGNQSVEVVFKGLVGNRGNGIYQNNSNSPTIGGWNAQVQTTGGIINLCWGERRPDANTWYHLLLSVNGSEAAFYVDGVEKARAALPGDVIWSGDNLVIARDFGGIIDEVRFYRRELSAAEVVKRFDKFKDNRW